VTLAPKGLLIEEQRTNLLLRSEEFDDASWTKANASITANTIVGPNGTLTGEKLINNSGSSGNGTFGGNGIYRNASSMASGSIYTISVYVKAGESNTVGLSIADSNFGVGGVRATADLVALTTTNVSNATSSLQAAGNGWYRFIVTSTTALSTTGTPRCYVYDPTTGDGTSGIFIWGAQLESGSFSTSYIPTTTAAATRAADVAVMQGANFSNWYNQTEGTLYVDAIEKPDTVTRIFASITDGTTEGYATATFGNTGRIRAQNVSSGGIGTTVTGQPFKIGYSFESGSQSGSLNSSAIVTTSTTVTVVPTMFRIGSNQTANSFWCSHIRRIAYYPRKLSSSELQGITA
jgi:hypothetical protein